MSSLSIEANEITVSIICNTYNHELYVRDALEGFIKQETNFGIEILIHDDASTDATAQIIREYEEKYPHLIKPIYQTENQYSKGIKISATYHYPRIRGKYIAFCEGDDYWTDPLKLQKQVDALEAHPEIDMCAHSTKMINAQTGEPCGEIAPFKEDTIISIEDVIFGDGGYVSTNSLLYRASLIKQQYNFRKFLTLDYTMQIMGSLRGGMLYLGDYMSVYRAFVANSWTHSQESDPDKKNRFILKKQEMLKILDEETEFKYTEVIHQTILKLEFERLIHAKQYKQVLAKEFTPYRKKLSLKTRIKLHINARLPFIAKIVKKVKGTRMQNGK